MTQTYGKVSIYALSDPTTHRVFYVGRSLRPQSRFTEHMTEAERFRQATEDVLERLFGIETTKKRETDGSGNGKKLKWILSILDRGLEVEFTILDEWTAPTVQDANRLEDAWIAEMRHRGHPLSNVIYSRRMNPKWYGKTNPYFKPGWAETPQAYISMLKAGVIGSARESNNVEDDVDETRAGKQYSQRQRRYFARRSAVQTAAVKNKIAASKRKSSGRKSPKRR